MHPAAEGANGDARVEKGADLADGQADMGQSPEDQELTPSSHAGYTNESVCAPKLIDDLGLEFSSQVIKDTKFEIPKRYTAQNYFGCGAYAVVCSAQDEETGELVAIKKISNVFEYLNIAKRMLRELRILRHLRHENIIRVQDVFLAGPKASFADIYVVTELMEADLAEVIRYQELSADHCQFLLYQIFRGTKYMHSAGVIHRDLRPRNLLVSGDCDLKIIDFGLARVKFTHKSWNQSPMTDYVCARWYRAPEMLCAFVDYGKACDMWSIGCIFAEMRTRKPLFRGRDTKHMLQLIIDCLGRPEEKLLDRVPNERCRSFLATAVPGKSALQLKSKVSPLTEADGFGLLEQLLQINPESRSSVEEALQNPYLADLYNPEDEPTRSPLECGDFEFERRKVDLKAIREEIFLEAIRYYPQRRDAYIEQQMSNGDMYNVKDYLLRSEAEPQVVDLEDEFAERGHLLEDAGAYDEKGEALGEECVS